MYIIGAVLHTWDGGVNVYLFMTSYGTRVSFMSMYDTTNGISYQH